MAAEGRRRLRAAVGLRVNHFRYPHARARGARRRFQIAVSFFSFSGATPAMPRLAALAAAGAGGGAQSRPSYAVAAEGRSRLRAAVGERQPFPLPSRARARRQAPSAVSFFSFSGATPAMPRLAALAAAGAGGGAQSRPSYAVAAEGRSRLRAAVGGLRRVLALDFQVGFPAGAVGLFSSRPARAIYFLWIGDGRATPRLRLAARAPAPPLWVTLLCALRNSSASTISVTLTRAREAPGADSRSRFHFLVSAARRRRCRGWRRWPPLVPAAELNRGRATRWLPKAARASAPP